jgi:hypothetical protein
MFLLLTPEPTGGVAFTSVPAAAVVVPLGAPAVRVGRLALCAHADITISREAFEVSCERDAAGVPVLAIEWLSSNVPTL